MKEEGRRRRRRRRWKKLLARYTGDCDALRRELEV
jgi:hypothetical protein